MVYKSTDNTKVKIELVNIIFLILIIMYFSGLCCGCKFAFKNSHNMAFVQNVIDIDKMIKIENNGIYAVSVQYFIRDVVMLCRILILKYSGILKGLCLSVSFIVAVQNSCIYSYVIYQNKLSLFRLILDFVLKDTAIIIILLFYTCIISKEIIKEKYNPKKDIFNSLIYISAMIMVYIIDSTVKIVL